MPVRAERFLEGTFSIFVTFSFETQTEDLQKLENIYHPFINLGKTLTPRRFDVN